MELKTEEIELSVPVEHDGVTYDRLTMHEPLAGDLLEAAEAAGQGAHQSREEAQTFARLCSVPFPVITKLRARDYHTLQGKYGFLVWGESVSETSDEESSDSPNGPGGAAAN